MNKTWTWLSAAAAGALFAFGLGLGGMTDPGKVQGFLDFSSRWDPALVWVMAGAVLTHLTFRGLALKSLPRPVFAAKFPEPTQTRVDVRLVTGAAVFGAGWGLAGLCPGPAVTSLPTLAPDALLFSLALIAGLSGARLVDLWHERRAARRAAAPLARAVQSFGPELTNEGSGS